MTPHTGALLTRWTNRSAPVVASLGLSYIGDWMTTVAVSVALLSSIGVRGPALYVAARVGLRPLGTVLGGIVTRHAGARIALIAAQILQAACAATMAICLAVHAPYLVVMAAGLAQLLGAAGAPARMHILARTTGRPTAHVMGTHASVQAGSVVAGPALGAILTLAAGPEVVFLIDAVTFLICAAVLESVVRTDPATDGAYASEPRARLRDRPRLVRLALTTAVNAGLITVVQAALAVVARDRFGHVDLVGVFYTAVGAGGVAAGLLVRRYSLGSKTVTITALAESAMVLAFAFSGHSIVAAVAALTLCGAASAAYQTAGSVQLVEEAGATTLAGLSSAVMAWGQAGMVLGAAAAAALPIQSSAALAVCAFAAMAMAALLSLPSPKHRPPVRHLAAPALAQSGGSPVRTQ